MDVYKWLSGGYCLLVLELCLYIRRPHRILIRGINVKIIKVHCIMNVSLCFHVCARVCVCKRVSCMFNVLARVPTNKPKSVRIGWSQSCKQTSA